MKKLVAIILSIALIAGSAIALSVPGTDTGYINVTGDKHVVAVTVEVRYAKVFTTLPTLHLTGSLKSGPKRTDQSYVVLAESLTGFTARVVPTPGKTLRLSWTATQRVKVLYAPKGVR